MNAIQFRKAFLAWPAKNRDAYAVWTPFVFSVFLSLIVVLSHLSASFRLKSPPSPVDTWFPAFFCFLPLTFFHVCTSLKQCAQDIKRLEARVQQLEADKACS